jgi:2-polyprenyl-3-methyl-5-hydroxy-6-metoxy-1,4-benzoquinol methylase
MAAPLKRFHNKIKRLLIQRFALDCDSLLDIACGRGGDLLKWVDADIKYVRGFDIAEEEVCSAIVSTGHAMCRIDLPHSQALASHLQ